MKHGIILLLISCSMAIMQECMNGDRTLVSSKVHAPVSAELNGELYSSNHYVHLGWANYWKPSLNTRDSVFYFDFHREITSLDDTAEITVSLMGEAPVELYKEYKLGANREEGWAIIWVDQGDRGTYGFTSTEGHFVFTKCAVDTLGQVYRVSGNFEFIAAHSETDSTIVVTNGTFENFDTN